MTVRQRPKPRLSVDRIEQLVAIVGGTCIVFGVAGYDERLAFIVAGILLLLAIIPTPRRVK